MTATQGYDQCETALQTILQGVSGMSSLVKLSDYTPFDDGETRFIVLQPDDFDSGDSDAEDRMVYSWSILVELFQKFTNETETMTNFRAFRKAVINELEKYPTLNNATGVLSRTFASEGGIPDVKDKDALLYRMQTIRVTVVQEVTSITNGEFA